MLLTSVRICYHCLLVTMSKAHFVGFRNYFADGVMYDSHRAYPSLKLTINVNASRNEVDVVLPGLRFDDIDFTGQPDTWRIFDMVNRVENAAFFTKDSFLDYDKLYQENYFSIVKACIYEAKSSFYETTTPKGPLDVSIKLAHIGNSSFTTVSEVFCGGGLKPSIRIKNMHTLISATKRQREIIPDWWQEKHKQKVQDVEKPIMNIVPQRKPNDSFAHFFAVPMSDTDFTEHTRCASYLRYFIENSSIASHRRYYKNIKKNFHDFHIKRLTLLYFAPSSWGEGLLSETWEGDDPLTLHCQISKSENPKNIIWYGKMELHSEAFGLMG